MSQDDFAFEPIRGLPERPPEGEVILWQGQPNWLRLTVDSLNLWWVLAYFIFLFVWRFISVSDLMPIDQALLVSFPFLALALIVALLLLLVGFIQAKATVYTITNKRIVMRIGAALTLTLNLPFTEIINIDDHTFKKEIDLISVFEKKNINPYGKIAFTCGSGITACVLGLTNSIISGKKPVVYDGSWSEYGIK